MQHRQIPSFNWLRVFEAAASCQSFARAAEQLAMSPAAVSQQIKALESHFKQALFLRGAHSVTLTDAGKAFLPVVQQSLRSIDTTAAALFGNPQQKALSIEGSLMFNCSWLAARLPDFQRKFADVHLQLSTSDEISGYGRGDKDLQITFGMGPTYGQEGDRLYGELLYPVATPEIADSIDSLADLLDYRLIEINSHRTSWFQVLSGDDPALIDRARFCFADNTVIALSMAAAGYGIALARAPASDWLCSACNLVPCLAEFSISSPQEYYLIYPAFSGLSATARDFRDWLLQTIADEGIET
jgi:LysR family glycine cleavage system transcriptional activator